MENRPIFSDYLQNEYITFFSSKELTISLVTILRNRHRAIRVAIQRDRLKEKVLQQQQLQQKSSKISVINKIDIGIQTNISIAPLEYDGSDITYSSEDSIDDVSASDDDDCDEKYRNCIIKKINRKSVNPLLVTPTRDHPELQVSTPAIRSLEPIKYFIKTPFNEEIKDKKEINYIIAEEEYIWDLLFREGISEYDSPSFKYCDLDFRMSLVKNGDNAKMEISLLNKDKTAKVGCEFTIHSLLQTLSRSSNGDFHFSTTTSLHHGVTLSGFDLLTFLEFGKIKFSVIMISKIDQYGNLIGNHSK